MKLINGTFVNHSTGEPNISNTLFDIGSNIGAAWESVGPTGSGATNIWTALDSVPVDADWIEVRIYSEYNLVGDTASAVFTDHVYARADGSSAAVSSDTEVMYHSATSSSSGGGDYGSTINVKIPIAAGVLFDLYATLATLGGTSARNLVMYLTGYGYNA